MFLDILCSICIIQKLTLCPYITISCLYLATITKPLISLLFGIIGVTGMDTLIPAKFLPLPPSCLGYAAYDVSKRNGGSGKNFAGIKDLSPIWITEVLVI